MKNEQRYDERDYAAIQSGYNLDANETMFFARELEHIKTKAYEKQFPELTATKNIPVSNEANPGAEVITCYMYEPTGMAKIISNYSTDLPRADSKGKSYSANVKGVANSYGYSIQDVRAARMAGKPLEQRKANAARQANDQTVNKIAYFGDTEHNLVGLFTHPNVTVYVLPADGTGSSTKLVDKTPDQAIRDLNGIVNKVVDITGGVENPDTMLMPHTTYSYLASTPRSSTSETTILEYFLKHNPYIKQVIPTPECKGAGTAGADLLFVYKKDPDKVTLEIPQGYEQFAPQAKGLEYEVPCHSRCAGVIFHFPLSASKASGI